jgi:hypothetical protein
VSEWVVAVDELRERTKVGLRWRSSDELEAKLPKPGRAGTPDEAELLRLGLLFVCVRSRSRVTTLSLLGDLRKLSLAVA